MKSGAIHGGANSHLVPDALRPPSVAQHTWSEAEGAAANPALPPA